MMKKYEDKNLNTQSLNLSTLIKDLSHRRKTLQYTDFLDIPKDNNSTADVSSTSEFDDFWNNSIQRLLFMAQNPRFNDCIDDDLILRGEYYLNNTQNDRARDFLEYLLKLFNLLKDPACIPEQESLKALAKQLEDVRSLTNKLQESNDESEKNAEYKQKKEKVKVTDLPEYQEEEKLDKTQLKLRTSTLARGANAIKEFKECLKNPNPYRIFFNRNKSGMIVGLLDQEGVNNKKIISFQIRCADNRLRNISFQFCRTSICVRNSAIICYIDRTFKTDHPEIYKEFGFWVLYADLRSLTSMITTEENIRSIELKKLFQITRNRLYIQRCLVMTDNSIAFFGGKFRRLDLKNEFEIYQLKHQQPDNTFKMCFGNMNHTTGQCIAVSYRDVFYVCQQENPTFLEILSVDKVLHSISIPIVRSSLLGMQLVKYNKPDLKDMILLMFDRIGKKMCFRLFNLAKEEFDDGKIRIWTPFDSSRIEINKNDEPYEEAIIYKLKENNVYRFVSLDIHGTYRIF